MTDSANKINHTLNFKLTGRLSEVNKPSLEGKHISYWYVGLGHKRLQCLYDIDCLFPATAQLLCMMHRIETATTHLFLLLLSKTEDSLFACRGLTMQKAIHFKYVTPLKRVIAEATQTQW